jgi:hypothetical protein
VKAAAGSSISFTPGLCCGKRDYEYAPGGVDRDGQMIEAWVLLRCLHCKRTTRILGYCKQAGDGDATNRQHKYRQIKVRKFVDPSTGARMTTTLPAASVAAE